MDGIMWLVVVTAYIMVAVYVCRQQSIRLIDRYGRGTLIETEIEDVHQITVVMFAGIFWPLALLVWFVMRETKKEKQKRFLEERIERAAAVREVAEAHGLPVLDTEGGPI